MSKHKERPNIIVILTDDQGAWAVGCAGNPDVKTPNIDRLAASGVRFSNFFCTRSEEHTSELQSRGHLVCRLLLEKKKKTKHTDTLDGHRTDAGAADSKS